MLNGISYKKLVLPLIHVLLTKVEIVLAEDSVV